MYDALVSLTDIVANFWSMGVTERRDPLIVDGFRASDGWFVVQVGRRHQFERLCEVIGRPGWLEDPRLPTALDATPGGRSGPASRLGASRTKHEAAASRPAKGCAGPCNDGGDPSPTPLAARNMLVEIPGLTAGRGARPGNLSSLGGAGNPRRRPMLGADTGRC